MLKTHRLAGVRDQKKLIDNGTLWGRRPLSFSLGGNKNQGESPLFPLLTLRLNKSTPSSDWCNTALDSLDFTGFNHT